MTTGIYIIQNLINGKKYVGQSVKIEIRIKEHHRLQKAGSLISKAIKKYGWENFKVDIIEAPRAELNLLEIFYIEKENSLVPNGYNLTKGGAVDSSFVKVTPESTRQKQSIASKGKPKSEQHKQAIGESKKGKPAHPNSAAALLKSAIGREKSEEEKRKIGAARKGKPLSKEVKQKLREANLGKRESKESIEKRRQKLIGRKRTPEERLKIKEGKKKAREFRELNNIKIIMPPKTPETIEIIRQKNLGQKRSEEQKQRMREGKRKAKEAKLLLLS